MNTSVPHQPEKSKWRDRLYNFGVVLFWVLAALIIYEIFQYVRPNRTIEVNPGRARPDIQSIITQLEVYERLNGAPPSTAQRLQALVTMPTDEPKLRDWRQLLPVVPVDSWGKPYQYRHPATKTKGAKYDVFSMGRDQMPDTADDIGNWQDFSE